MRKSRDYRIQYIINRLQERSTWTGIVFVASTIFGISDPEKIESYVSIGLGLSGTVSMLFPDKLLQEDNTQQEKEEA